MSQVDLKKIRDEIASGGRLVFLGGAGVSTGSGILDFRSPQGLYNIQSKYGVPYEVMLSHSYFLAHTETFYDFYFSTMVCKDAKPNKAHYVLAEYEKKHPETVIITQNIDGLHQKAGSKRVFEAHGTTESYHCMKCHKHYSLDEISTHGVPHCSCGGILKPDVVLYEEPLDAETMDNALLSMRMADTLIIGGTSMRVYPIAGLPNYFQGSRIIMVNAEPTPFDRHCDYVIHGDIGDTLEALLG